MHRRCVDAHLVRPQTEQAPGIVERYLRLYPAAQVKLEIGNTTRIAERVAELNLDMALVEGEISHPDLEATDWLGDRSLLKSLHGRFAGMVLPGDDVTCSGSVASKDDETRRVVINLVVTNQRGEKVFNKGVAEAEFSPQKEQ